MKTLLCQLNPVVGDIEGNLALVRRAFEDAGGKPDLAVFPELFLTGYPPRDLLEYPSFIDRVEEALAGAAAITARFPGTGLLVGAPVRTGKKTGHGLYNAAILFCDGREVFRQAKSLLPNYDVFDEIRYFDPAPQVGTVDFKGDRLGISVCEDAWNAPEMWGRHLYDFDPIAEAARRKATLLVNISASPFTVGKDEARRELVSGHARRHRLPFIFVNQIGANDELVFDGSSLAFDKRGEPLAALGSFVEEERLVDTASIGSPANYQAVERIASVHGALVLGIRDYIGKCGFRQVVLGLSGGIDSAVTCALAVAALGPQNVMGVTMPSEFSSLGSVNDSVALARNLGIELRQVPISDVYHAYLGLLEPEFGGLEPDITEENIQARVRGNVLMAFSNKLGRMVLTTGNKSELAVGYCTLYGDMSGGLCVLADVPKTMVYQLACYINREKEFIPQTTIAKPASAELRPNQTDQDTLPSYDILDAIVDRYVEDAQSTEDIVRAGFDRRTVEWVIRAVNRTEFKRRQAAPGIKVTSKAFGMGRRMPVAGRY